MKTYRVLAAVLQYPEPDLCQATKELQHVLEQDNLLSRHTLKEMLQLFSYLATEDMFTLQSGYVDLFDRTPANSLHLFEHVYGDDRARGQAMADLMQVYEDAGLEMKSGETPDYLPLFLEHLSIIAIEDAQANLKEIVDLLGTLEQRLINRKSPYAAVFSALLELAKLKPNASKVQAALKLADGSLPDTSEIDALWAEEPAFDAKQPNTCPHAATCGQGGIS